MCVCMLTTCESLRAALLFFRYAYNYTLGWVLPNLNTEEDSVVVPLNAARLVDDLLAVHGHEALIDGCFNADPHPGNILCSDGKLALIDYGQVKRLTETQRLDLCKSFILVDAAIKVCLAGIAGMPICALLCSVQGSCTALLTTSLVLFQGGSTI